MCEGCVRKGQKKKKKIVIGCYLNLCFHTNVMSLYPQLLLKKEKKRKEKKKKKNGVSMNHLERFLSIFGGPLMSCKYPYYKRY